MSGVQRSKATKNIKAAVMKKLTLIALISLISFSGFAGTDHSTDGVITNFINKVFASKAKYPDQAREKRVEGTVWVEFIIYEDDCITNVKALSANGYGLECEAERVLVNMGAEYKEKIAQLGVTGRYRMPIRFDLL